ncbi:hypothetical protein [Lacticaseibacillus paracasei]|uniref:hypothetical protein n=1 Tax=Lacticaseibacillus paracasei TaxID=1597 RepID=UPI0021C2987E|nr:hypothetical protein [Lacticaseibacillus paracasei]MCP9309820.1 hypothetical protein [Lacticaseibacillus paracasei]MCP9346558.1 hypothetical protein [Lacticaseibacillus paracasei]MCP9366166.1 hypothetical protein [Lacticaseibacillus paracasei]MCP9378538.1 hypothetical protein [Lacticaseibacillus paracasei]
MIKRKLLFIVVPLMALLLFILSGCGSSMAGTYHGTSGRTTMTLSKDGTAGYGQIYSDGHTQSWHGKWSVSGDSIHIVLKRNSGFGFDLTGTIHDKDTFELPDKSASGNNGSWNDETFTRSN